LIFSPGPPFPYSSPFFFLERFPFLGEVNPFSTAIPLFFFSLEGLPPSRTSFLYFLLLVKSPEKVALFFLRGYYPNNFARPFSVKFSPWGIFLSSEFSLRNLVLFLTSGFHVFPQPLFPVPGVPIFSFPKHVGFAASSCPLPPTALCVFFFFKPLTPLFPFSWSYLPTRSFARHTFLSSTFTPFLFFFLLSLLLKDPRFREDSFFFCRSFFSEALISPRSLFMKAA